MTSNLSSWLTARRVTEADAHSQNVEQQGMPAPPTSCRFVILL